MKLNKIMILLILVGIFSVPAQLSSSTKAGKWTFGPWQTQSMISWGSDMLVVDFGPNGLWGYDGSWRRLSYMNPEKMITWGESYLVVDFGTHGLWKFDRSVWEKIAL